MNGLKTFIILTALIISVFITAGCTADTGIPITEDFNSSQQEYPAVSFNDTAVEYVQVNGVTLGYREFGSGEPLLMIQGFGATIDNWNETFIGILATEYHVFTYDHRGMGYSSEANATTTIPLYADDAALFMQALGYDSMNVYGVSMGSSVSQQLAIDHPDSVKKLVLDSNTYSVKIPETKKLLGEIEESASNSSMPEGIRREAEANLAWNGSWYGLSSIEKDVMLVVGTADDLTPDPVSVQMAGQINGSWLVRFQGLPHVGSHYAPVQYGENALYFLDTDESPLSP
ncbi:alpha/beta hydrolase fold protein [Methanolacinia petrolearia DSM 11571]|uniref:Alpha/beta hydrolase fold protein n=1 Tax=Methanolacinia petrolearia (strain DSM 11571 / OCM 486 / SEBR 4847) TaxID=679926 RepID=E1RF44_METP4|nr:alpha/beta hydrolase [Methanolacinia petrolearia]ADN37288.1 alpha/beta hydrolase fold protein [Methanolacinia petrolearia DSM 11571]